MLLREDMKRWWLPSDSNKPIAQPAQPNALSPHPSLENNIVWRQDQYE